MTDIVFLRLQWIWLLAAVLLWLGLWRLMRRGNYIASTTTMLLKDHIYRASVFRHLPLACLIVALVFVLLALMGPVLPHSEAQVQSHGLDIVLVLDLSSSMQEVMGLKRPPRTLARLTFSNRDAQNMTTTPTGKTRLETTKDALRDFISHRKDDRMALIVFSDNAYVVSPLTFDHDYLLHYVDMVDDKILRGEGMTAIGDGVTLGHYLLERQSKTESRGDKVIVVFTDGENNHGLDPVEAIRESFDRGIKVHVVGVDMEEEIKNKAEVLRLIDAVKRYGGRYYSADTTRQLQAAYLDIDTLEKSVLTNKVYIRNAPVFGWFVTPASIFMLLGFALRSIPYFVDVS